MTERDPNSEHYIAHPVPYPQQPPPAPYVQSYSQPNYPQPVSPSQPQQVMPAPGVSAKNPAIAAFLQFLFVGAGSVYAGQLAIGILWFCAAAIAWFLCLAFIGFILVPLIYIGAMIQAYVAASNFNRRNGIQIR